MKKERKKKEHWNGHLLKRDSLQCRIMEGRIQGTRNRGHGKFGMLTDIFNGRTFKTLKGDAQDHEKWRRLC